MNTWMHGGHLQIDKTKMSKSLGNFFTIRDVLEKYSAEVIRYFVIASHYRSQLNYSEESLENAKQALIRLYTALRNVEPIENENSEFEKRFIEAMDDDFNTPEALAVLFDIAKELNKIKESDKIRAQQLAGILKKLGNVLGILQQDPEIFLRTSSHAEVDVDKVEALIKAREKARLDKNWKEADRIRDELSQLNVTIEDTQRGTTWR